MAGWPGSYFQVIYPMGALAGTGTAPETPPPTLGGAPGGVAAVPAAAQGAVPITPAPVVMVSGPPVGAVPAPAAGSGGGTVPGPTTGTVSAAASGSAGGTSSGDSSCSSSGIGRWHSTNISACDWTNSFCPEGSASASEHASWASG